MWQLRGLGGAGIPVSMPSADPIWGSAVDFHQIEAIEYTDQLHPYLPPTTLWGYNPVGNSAPRHLGGLIVAQRNRPVRLRVSNNLPGSGHILPVDTTIMGYAAPNNLSVHLHGGLVPWISDGGPYAWFNPTGGKGVSFQNNVIPGAPPANAPSADYYYPNTQSSRLLWYHDHALAITRLNAYAGIATGYLVVDPAQEAALAATLGLDPGHAYGTPLVFQDKTFVSATTSVTDPTWATVAPKSTAPGSLWYPHVYDPKLYKLNRNAKNTALPNPSCVPEFFGDTMLVNGLVYPYVPMTPGRHRLRLLNACGARFLNLNLLQADLTTDGITLNPKTLFPVNPAGPALNLIGTEGGFLSQAVTFPNGMPFNPATLTGNLILAPAERADVIVDIPAGAVGTEYILYNDAPAPFPMGAPTNDYYLGNPKNPTQPLPGNGPDTRQILRIKVVASGGIQGGSGTTPVTAPGVDAAEPLLVPVPTNPVAPLAPLAAPAGANVRNLTLNEAFDMYGRLEQRLGTTAPAAAGGFGLAYSDPPTEVVAAGAIEVWNIFNTTADTHPMHFHLVNVQVLSRQPFQVSSFKGTPNFSGPARGPELEELGWKETVRMHPGECTTIAMKFDLPAAPFTVPSSNRFPATLIAGKPTNHEYVWHCHILEHEEHDMMRPLIVCS